MRGLPLRGCRGDVILKVQSRTISRGKTSVHHRVASVVLAAIVSAALPTLIAAQPSALPPRTVPAAILAPTVANSAVSRTAAGSGISRDVLNLALSAVQCGVAHGDLAAPPTLTVIDYSLPSTAPRLWVFDMQNGALLFKELVAHGKGTGDNMA
jgi:hypothetical protein